MVKGKTRHIVRLTKVQSLYLAKRMGLKDLESHSFGKCKGLKDLQTHSFLDGPGLDDPQTHYRAEIKALNDLQSNSCCLGNPSGEGKIGRPTSGFAL